MGKQRTFDELLEQVVIRNPGILKLGNNLNVIIDAIAELVYEDAQLHTPTKDMVICLLYDRGKEMWNKKTNH